MMGGMARDAGLEAMVEEALEDLRVTRKAMFGGMAWMYRGNLVCGARVGHLLVRLGKGNDAWALALPGVTQMMSGKPMNGWVRVPAEVYADDAVRQRLLDAAKAFVMTLPAKE